MIRSASCLPVALLALALSACSPGPKSAQGFRLPDGEVEAGKLLFVEMQCHACHSIVNVELPEPQETGAAQFALGGKVTRVKTYGALVSSVINPSHKLAPGFARNALTPAGTSPMRNYNDVMTVQQLIDLVAFLQSTYEVVAPSNSYYTYTL